MLTFFHVCLFIVGLNVWTAVLITFCGDFLGVTAADLGELCFVRNILLINVERIFESLKKPGVIVHSLLLDQLYHGVGLVEFLMLVGIHLEIYRYY